MTFRHAKLLCVALIGTVAFASLPTRADQARTIFKADFTESRPIDKRTSRTANADAANLNAGTAVGSWETSGGGIGAIISDPAGQDNALVMDTRRLKDGAATATGVFDRPVNLKAGEGLTMTFDICPTHRGGAPSNRSVIVSLQSEDGSTAYALRFRPRKSLELAHMNFAGGWQQIASADDFHIGDIRVNGYRQWEDPQGQAGTMIRVRLQVYGQPTSINAGGAVISIDWNGDGEFDEVDRPLPAQREDIESIDRFSLGFTGNLPRGAWYDNFHVVTDTKPVPQPVAAEVDTSQPVVELSATIGQIGAPFAFVSVPGEPDAYYHVQQTRAGDERLFLTANNVYFRPAKGPMIVGGQGPAGVEDVAPFNINQNRSFAFVHNWSAGDQADWGIWLENAGKLNIAVNTSAATGARFALRIGDQTVPFTSRSGANGQVQLAVRGALKIERPGFHTVTVECLEPDGKGQVQLNWIELSGEAARRGGVVRVRWRPAASHATFTSSKNDRPVRLWVIEMDAKPGTNNFYAPIATPFGYYGSTWLADGTVGTGINFSLWSFGQGDEEPLIERLSQIVAVGHPDAAFGGFSHEGTGVKIRNWSPLKGRQGQRQAFALRYEPGEPTEEYDTFYSYFYASDEKRWRLFGVGQTFKGERNDPAHRSMRIGSFVEVPGPVTRQRTGPYERQMRYRGWVMNDAGQWSAIDRMTNGNVGEHGLTHTYRGINDEGWFFNQTGGWKWRVAPEGSHIEHHSPAAMDDVDYMQPEALRFLMSVPCEIDVTQLQRTGSTVTVRYMVRHVGKDAKVTAFWGLEDGRALRDRWANSKVATDTLRDGMNQLVLDNVPEGKPIHVGLLLENNEGRFFTRQSAVLQP